MVPAEPVYVAAFAAATPVGRDVWSSAAAVRAGVSGLTQHPFMIDSAGEPMKVALVPWLGVQLTGTRRLQSLLYPVIDQLLGWRTEVAPNLRMALALALPSMRPGAGAELSTEMLAGAKARYGDAFDAAAAFPNGHAAGLLALDVVCGKLAQGAFDACIVAGVESYMAPETLEWLEKCDQLHGAGRLNNAWGFIPGEGAGAILLVRGEVAHQCGNDLHAQVLGVGVAKEAKHLKTETVCIGEGLTQAFKGALQGLPAGEKITDVYCDMNGEPYRADEYGFTCLRTGQCFESAADFVAPADCWGDVSAASVPLQIALASIAGRKGYAKGATAFVWASSEKGERGAVTLRVRQGVPNAG
jgi:3-oxoacyl-[acyl-carrier-protein] synthase-1